MVSLVEIGESDVSKTLTTGKALLYACIDFQKRKPTIEVDFRCDVGELNPADVVKHPSLSLPKK